MAPFRLTHGIQNKVLEAMAVGLPVVGTSQAFNGITATAAHGIRIADDPQHLAQELIALLMSHATRRQQCALRTRHYLETPHQWHEQGIQLERLLQGVLRTPGTDASLMAHRQ